jgi:oligosaccharide repeat unit polymerase
MLLLLILLSLSCVFLIGWGFTGPNRSLRFASLLGATVAGFVVPQVIGLHNSGAMHNSAGALEMFAVMTFLCMASAFAGDLLGYRRSQSSRLRPLEHYDWRKITEAALFLNIIAFVAGTYVQLIYYDDIVRGTTQSGGMSGPMVIVIFFAAVHRYGFALALVLYWHRRSVLSLAMIMFGAIHYVLTIVMMARRGPALEFVFILVLTFAIVRRKHIPALLITILFVGGTLWSGDIAHFRERGMDIIEKVETSDLLGRFFEVFEQGGGEVRNGALVIEYTYDTGEYEFGKLHWNKLVHGYFPGQIFGYDVKESLKFKLVDVAAEENQRRNAVGTASTGIADCFSSFGYFGCLKYVVIGFVMGRWYRKAFAGDLPAQLAYSTLISTSLLTISHGTSVLLNDYIHMAVFSYPLLYWARKPARLIARSPVRRWLPPGGAVSHVGSALGLR